MDFPVYSAKSKIKAWALLTGVILLFAIILKIAGIMEPYSMKTLDILFRLAPLPPASPQVVMVTVDQPDVDFFKEQGINWPWPRQLYAPIIEFCQRGGARAVIFDLLYTEPSFYGPEDDQQLAKAAAGAGNVVFACFLTREEKGANPQEAELLAKAGLTISGPPPQGFPDYRAVIAPVAPLVQAANTLGNVECGPDPDGIYRRLPLAVPFKGRWLPLLGFSAFQRSAAPGEWRFDHKALVHGAYRLPLDSQGRFLLKFRGPARSHKRFSAANVIQSEIRLRHNQPPLYPADAFKDKWVFVGLTAPGLFDLKASPVSPIYPGVELHATLLDNLIQGDFLCPAPVWFQWLLTGVLAAGLSLAVLFTSGLWAPLLALGTAVVGFLGLTVLLFWASWWSDPVLPGVALASSFALASVYSYATEGRQKQAIRRMFAQYMSETVINHLLAHPEKLKLGGERRRVTLFFSDLAGFTTLSERLQPEAVVALLNEYLSRMTEIILEEMGTVDKFEGDAIMAFWGAPLDQEDQAVRACRTALRQQAALIDLNRHLSGQGLPALSMRIGLHTGEAIVGNLGSQSRFDYTVIGDNVNLASRLEGLNKFYGTGILASEATVAESSDGIEFWELDRVAVKGREAPVTVFNVMALRGGLSPAQAAAREEYARGLECFRRRLFEEAERHFLAALEKWPGATAASVFLGRCRALQKNPPPPAWDAVFRPDKK
ncbi:MAG: adenylate/guanylate cyclase domain-containing protein [Deltaproteobacteria bacterium]|nr:adenylate/guanylate cyclase domain-containing protein [Deltaproteobacteria bacterium]